MIGYMVLLAFLCEAALIALAFRTRVRTSTLVALRAYRNRHVRDLRGVTLIRRNAR